MERKYKCVPGIYQELDIDRGLGNVSLDKWKRLGDASLHIKNYTKLGLINQRVDRVVGALTGASHETCEIGRLGSQSAQALCRNIKLTLYSWFYRIDLLVSCYY